jgi:RecB family exonuclease
MAGVFETILEKIHSRNTFFVFPSETAAVLWARKICLYGGIRSLSPGRFLAWDRFKEETGRVHKKKCRPVSSLIRRLFALALARHNAGSPFLQALIPAAYAESGAVFADSIALILSSLNRWEELQDAAVRRDDDEDRDLRIIKSKYAAFLEEHSLFEPSWERSSFNGGENRYIIFFPEVLEDFAEYAKFLDSPAVTLYSTEEFSRAGPAEKPGLVFFDSARQEIRAAVLELRRLCEAGMPCEDAALSLPDFSTMAPYVERELALHDIPFSRRAGKSLGEYPIGRLFSLAGECSTSFFSFDAMKLLLLDCGIPWKDAEKNRALVDYGIENHCAAPFRDRFRTVDAWEESFKQNPNRELAVYYGELKRNLSALTGAKSFRKIQEQYHVFRSFLDMEKCSPESDAVLARCIEELSALADTEEAFPDLTPTAPFAFYVSHLKEKKYVYAGNGGGVNLYDYPVAAGAPFGCHMVLNATQAAAAVQHRPLPFLRQDKRARLGITDTDVSLPVLALYNMAPWKDYACHTRISASEKSFSGWAIPHFALNPERRKCAAGNPLDSGDSRDFFTLERHWRARKPANQNYGEKPAGFYSVQREGFLRWIGMLQFPQEVTAADTLTADTSIVNTSTTATSTVDVSALLRERLRSKNADRTGNSAVMQELSVSATDLNEFFTCRRLWLYRRIFRLEPHEADAALLDNESRGLLYHEILFRLFDRIKKTDTCFLKENLPAYFEWIEEISASVLRSSDTLRGPLVYPLLTPLAASMNRRLRSLLKAEAAHFNGLEVQELEQRYDLIQGRLRLTGRIDRVSRQRTGDGPVIMDYKTSTAPSLVQCRWNEESGLQDFQIPMYIKLYEAVTGTAAAAAFFVKINEHKFISVMGEFGGKEFSREAYQPAMDALDKAIEQFCDAVTSLNFRPTTIPYKTCFTCAFKTICRSLYSLNTGAVGIGYVEGARG